MRIRCLSQRMGLLLAAGLLAGCAAAAGKWSWSFAGGLTGWAREGDARTLRLLWIPLRF